MSMGLFRAIKKTKGRASLPADVAIVRAGEAAVGSVRAAVRVKARAVTAAVVGGSVGVIFFFSGYVP